MKKYALLKYLIPLLMAAAIALGFYQRTYEPYLQKKTPVTHITQPSSDSLLGYYQKSQEIARDSQEKTTVTFLAAGDIVLSRSVAATIQKSGNPDLPFEKMATVLTSTDFNFANLESPVSGSSAFGRSGSMVFNAPEEYADKLKNYNFKVLNLANNHAFDQGLKGLLHTQNFLDTLGIRHTGTGSTTAEAWQSAIVDAKGMKICFIGASYASVNDNGKTTNQYVARIEDTERLKRTISELRGVSQQNLTPSFDGVTRSDDRVKSSCDFIVATMHAGTEYTRKPNQSQIDFAHAAIEDGADMVIGAHPHWSQTIEKYKEKYIFYSLGNFIFDQEWSQETKEGLTLKITISKSQSPNSNSDPKTATLSDLQGPRQPAKLESVELIPVIIENYSTPRPATAEESKKILGEIGETQTVLK